jgi:septum formation protein
MALWLADRPLVLASKSEARSRILRDAGIAVDIVPADLDERLIEQRVVTCNAGEIAALLAREKARTVADHLPGRLVLGADQILTLDGRRFSKPADRVAAGEQLKALRGRTHQLISAAALVRDGEVMFEHRDLATLTMRAFTDEFLDAYLTAMGPAVTMSVGVYQLERSGIQLFERIEGDHFVILGLPVLSVLAFLRNEGLLAK